MLKDDVIENLNQKVVYDGSVYLLQKYVAWVDESTKKLKHSLILLDKNKNSIIAAPMEKVNVINNEN